MSISQRCKTRKREKSDRFTVTIKGQIMHKGSRERERDEDEKRNNDLLGK